MIARSPYAQLLGLRETEVDVGSVGLVMPASPELEGRKGFLYGGAIASLLELACLQVIGQELADPARRPKPINMTFDFLRGGRMIDTYALARIVRVGRRIVNADALCWQADKEKPIATGRMHVLLPL